MNLQRFFFKSNYEVNTLTIKSLNFKNFIKDFNFKNLDYFIIFITNRYINYF